MKMKTLLENIILKYKGTWQSDTQAASICYSKPAPAQGAQGADFSGLAAAQWLQNKDTPLTNTRERGPRLYEQYLLSGSGPDLAPTDHKEELCWFWQQ